MLFLSLTSSGSGGTGTTPPTCPPRRRRCPCGTSSGGGGNTGGGNSGGGGCTGSVCSSDSSPTSEASDFPIRYQNGEIQMSVTDISASGLGMPWGHTRTYCNQLGVDGTKTSVDFGNGFNWLTETTAYLVDILGNGGEIQVVISPRDSFWFTSIDDVYVGAFGALQTFVHDATNHVYRFIDTDGSVWEFFDFEQIENPAGLLSSIVSPGGESSLVFKYPNAVSMVSEVERSYTDCCLLSSTRVYHLIPTPSGTGVSGTNYDQTTYGYDSMKRRNREVATSGTITRTVYDVRGLTSKVYIGTNDTGATQNDPTGGGASGNNMVQITGMVYDDGMSGGDGNLTKNTAYVDASSSRVTSFLYDFRNRRTATNGEVSFYEEVLYDNLNRVIRRDRKNSTAAGNLIAQSETKFDARNRVYRTLRYAVNPSTGLVGDSLSDNTWYDASRNVLCTLPAGSDQFSKNVYDGIARMITSYSGYTPSGPINPSSITSDVIFEQGGTTYDNASNVTATTFRQRWDNATGNGSLNGPTTQPKSRNSYTANWSDALGRTIATANYGTNNDGSQPTRPGTVPASSDTVLVNQIHYNNTGEGFETVDAAGKVDRTYFDNAGRTTKTIQNFTSGGTPPANEQNVTVEQTYSAGFMVTLTAKNPETGDQVTTYTYGVTLSNSDIASNELLRSETYPDSVDASDKVTYTYNRQGQPTTKTDQNESVHSYSYDKLGRQTADSITTLGSGADDAVLRIGQAYEIRGMVATITSYSDVAGTTPVNQVRNLYNHFGQLITQFQEHGGAVDTGTTPKVGYGYENGSANTIRPKSIVYPNGTVLSYLYNDTHADRLSRIRTLRWNGTQVCRYTYLGVNAFVTTDYLQPQVKLNYATGSGIHRYNGVDRFGRVVNLPWTNYGTPVDLVHLKYGYNRISNRIWREDIVAQANSQNFDELYGYDGMQRLEDFERGLLNGGHNAITSPTFEQEWELDATGNWMEFDQTVPPNPSQDFEQERTNNTVNEITDITTDSATWITPEYDRNGNSTLFPTPSDPTDSYTGTWDAWNRLVAIHDSSTALVASYAYDGQNWRITKTSGISTRHYYYSSNWQALEERIDTSTTSERQFVWGIRYIDDLILRDRDGTPDERLYALQDANWNVTAIADTSGVVQERFAYQAYGTCTVLDPSFVPSSPSFDWEITYASYRFDPESALYQVRNRYLHSTLGNWISRDPIGYEGSSYDLYEYVSSNPCVGLDSSGMTLNTTIRHVTQQILFDTYFFHRAYTGDPNGGLAKATPAPNEVDDIEESSEGYCATVKRAVTLRLTVLQVMPTDAVASGFATPGGYMDLVQHEQKRLTVYSRANDTYLVPMEGAGSVATACGTICRCTKGEAKEELQKYLVNNRALALSLANGYIDTEQNGITVGDAIVGVLAPFPTFARVVNMTTMTGMSARYRLKTPPKFKPEPCPTSEDY